MSGTEDFHVFVRRYDPGGELFFRYFQVGDFFMSRIYLVSTAAR